jgi:hypothetical protein
MFEEIVKKIEIAFYSNFSLPREGSSFSHEN